MKKALMLILLAFPFAAQARIGDTVDGARERYGKEIHVDNKTGYMVFLKGGFQIGTFFHQGKIEAIVFAHEQKGFATPEITEKEMETLMKANFGGLEWKEIEDFDFINTVYLAEGGQRLAVHNTIKHTLMIGTKEYMDRSTAQKEAEEEKKIEGF